MRRGFAGASLMFASNGAIFASLLPWYPSLVEEWGLSGLQFGLTVAAMPLGSLVSSALPAKVVAWRGPLFAAVAPTVVMGALLAAIGHVPGAAWLAAALFVFGVCDATADVGQNVAGTRVEARAGRSIISRLHAFWSVGATAGGAAASWSAMAGNSFAVHLAVSAVVCAALVALGAWLVGDGADPLGEDLLHDADPDLDDSLPAWSALRAALLAVLPLAAVAMAGTSVEELGQNWGGLAANQLAGLPAATAGVTYPVLLGAQTVGRFAGDAAIDRFGRVRVAVGGGALITVGGVLVLVGGGYGVPAVLIGGFGLAGLGCATLVPSAFAAAARMPGVSDGAGVTLIGWLMRIGFLITSPVIGAIANGAGLLIALGLLVILGIVAVACAPALREREKPGAAEPAA